MILFQNFFDIKVFFQIFFFLLNLKAYIPSLSSLIVLSDRFHSANGIKEWLILTFNVIFIVLQHNFCLSKVLGIMLDKFLDILRNVIFGQFIKDIDDFIRSVFEGDGWEEGRGGNFIFVDTCGSLLGFGNGNQEFSGNFVGRMEVFEKDLFVREHPEWPFFVVTLWDYRFGSCIWERGI